jgi:hypothetical protein
VVIKRLRNTEDPQHVAMFLDEARIARQLSHPNIVQTFEIGREADAHLLVMEYLPGPTLGRLRRLAAGRGGVPIAIEIEILRGVLEGLHHAHELRAPDGRALKLVHRDLSSENVIVTQDGDCKILDFGIAKAARLQTVAPEQLRGLPVDRRADVFAAGVMLWEGLSGTSLWGNLGDIAISTRLVQGDIPPLRELAPQVPEALRAICETALAAQPEGRFDTALAMKAALMDYAGRNGLVVTRAQVAELVGPLFSDERERIDRLLSSQLARPRTPRPAPPSPGRKPVRIAVAAAALGAGGLWWWHTRVPPQPPPAQARPDEAAVRSRPRGNEAKGKRAGHGAAVFSPAPAKVAPPSLPRVYLPEDGEQLRRMCGRVESAVVTLAGLTPEYAHGITGRFQAQIGAHTEIYPAAMYYFIVREAGLKHDNTTAAAALVDAQRTRAILGLKDFDAIETAK